jgi:histidyl-tRNA synthetase
VAEAVDRLEALFANLDTMGAGEYCKLDMRIVRGLAYYTGIVYEIFDAGQSLRAVAGGGRYDNLLEVLGGPDVAATGFGMGDVVLGILLEEKGKLPELSQKLDFFVIDGEAGTFDRVMEVVGALRGQGLSAEFSYRRQAVGKQLKEANRRGAGRAVIIRASGVAVKDMSTGNQSDQSLDEFLSDPNRM